MSKLGVGVLGVGRLGRRHAENLKHRIPDAHLVAVADADGTVAMQVAEYLEVEHSYATVDGLLERKDVQAIVIATPSKFHAEAIQAVAQVGKHVFCEKPIALTLEAADVALAAVIYPSHWLDYGALFHWVEASDPQEAQLRVRGFLAFAGRRQRLASD
jgi:myo-inositol 2-dehydrogenase / D-chiro-inositol 1-dehydrogenase